MLLEHRLLYHQMGVVVVDRRRLQMCIRAANARRHSVRDRGGLNMYAGYMKMLLGLDIAADTIVANHTHRWKIAGSMIGPAKKILT